MYKTDIILIKTYLLYLTKTNINFIIVNITEHAVVVKSET